jgi:hypothetical protein
MVLSTRFCGTPSILTRMNFYIGRGSLTIELSSFAYASNSSIINDILLVNNANNNHLSIC